MSLSLLNLMVTILAFIIAIGAIWGYAALQDAAERKAQQTADQVSREFLKDYLQTDDTALSGLRALGQMNNAGVFANNRQERDFEQRPSSHAGRPTNPQGEENRL